MKRIMWFFALIPVAVTSIVLQFMPDIIPIYNIGKCDSSDIFEKRI